MKLSKVMIIISCLAILFLFTQNALAKDIVMKLGHGHSIEHPLHPGCLIFKYVVEKRSNGKIKVQIFPNNQLGSESEMVEMCKMGTLHGTITGRYEEMTPMIYSITMPFLFKNFDHVDRVLKGPIGDYLAKFFEPNGLKLVGWTHSGFRQITNNVKPIRTPDDLKGLKMRTPPLECVIKTMEAFGASPTPIPYPEVYMACKTGVVDGQENPYVNICTEKFYEVQKYMSSVNYIYLPQPFVVGLKWYNSLSPENQKIIRTAASIAVDYVNVLTVDSNSGYRQKLLKGGIKEYVPTDQERAQFIKRAQPVYKHFIDKGIANQQIIDLIQRTK